MSNSPQKTVHILKAIEDSIEQGLAIKLDAERKFRTQFQLAEQNRTHEMGQAISAEQQYYSERLTEEWLEDIDVRLKGVLENFEWDEEFKQEKKGDEEEGQNPLDVEFYLGKLYHLKKRYQTKIHKKPLEKELTINMKTWRLTNNRNKKTHSIAETQYQGFLKMIIDSNGVHQKMADVLDALKGSTAQSIKLGKDAADLKGRFNKVLKDELGMSSKFIENFIKTKNGFSADLSLVEIMGNEI